MSAESSSLMRSDASRDEFRACAHCAGSYRPRKSWQRYCSPVCRFAHHASQTDGGLRGVVKSNKLLKGGKRSVTLHFDSGEDVQRLEPGRTAEIL